MHKHHGIPDQQKLNYLLKSLLTKKASKLHITDW